MKQKNARPKKTRSKATQKPKSTKLSTISIFRLSFMPFPKRYFVILSLASVLALGGVLGYRYYSQKTPPSDAQVLGNEAALPAGCKYFSNLSTDSKMVDVSGSNVVWSDSRSSAGHDIYGQKWTATAPKKIIGTSGAQYWPKISGSQVIYSYQGSIYKTTFSSTSGSFFVKITDALAVFDYDIGNGWVVWKDGRNKASYDIYARKFGSTTESVISNSTYDDINVDVDGNLAVWVGSDGSYSYLMAYHLVNKTRYTLARSAVNGYPAISGNDTSGYLIAWSESPDQYSLGILKAGMFYPSNPSGFAPVNLTPNPKTHQLGPAVSGNLIVWQGDSPTTVGTAIKSFRYPNGPINTVIDGKGVTAFTRPKVSGNYVVWSETDASVQYYYYDVAGCDLSVRGL